MRLHFLGANRQVTGSRYCLEVGRRKTLIDCGMFQERAYLARNWEPGPIPPAEIDALLLTHVHIDHSGLIPRLVHHGFSGPIYCTQPSVPLAGIVLQDAAEIQVEDAAYKQKRHAKEGRRGQHPEIPLYTVDDAQRSLRHFQGVPYGRPLQLDPALRVTFYDAGHILGSAMLEVEAQENGQPVRLIFSGDIGQWNKPLVRDPTLFEQADYVVMESTYGDRLHDHQRDVESQLSEVIHETVRRGGNVVIPTFAVERAQELMYSISRLVRARQIPDVPVFLDSPMAVDVTEVFRQYQQCLDPETWELILSNAPPLHFPGLQLVRTVDESKGINRRKQPAVIMASSGMCNAGRIKFHLRQNIERPESTILFVGYQSQGTLGRQILEGKREVRIHGRMHRVRAHIAQIHGFSGHADRADLTRWLRGFRAPPRRLFLTHGEETVITAFAERIRRELGWDVAIPNYLDAVELPHAG